MDPNPMLAVLIRRGRKTERLTWEKTMYKQRQLQPNKIQMIYLQAKDCQGPLEPGRGKEGLFSRTFRGSMAL